MSDEKKKMVDPVARPTARDALQFADALHADCTVIAKSPRNSDSNVVRFKCVCGTMYIISANRFSTDALRNVPEDKEL